MAWQSDSPTAGVAVDFVGTMTNLTITASRSGGAETIALKTKAGTDPSDNDAITLAFRDAASTTGGYTLRTLAAASSLTIASGANLGVKESSTVTMTIASPCVVTWAGHGLRPGDPIVFTTTGALPTGITAGTTYYVASNGASNSFAGGSFQISSTVGGASINTSGSQSGTHTCTAIPSAKPFRLWLVMGDDGGTLRLGVIRCDKGSGGVYALSEDAVTSSTALSGSSNSSGVIYSTVAWTSKAIRILGFLEYTLPTAAGTWDSAPTKIQVFGQGIKKPGDSVQRSRVYASAVDTTTTTCPQTTPCPTNTAGKQFLTTSITPTSGANTLRVRHTALYASSTTDYSVCLITRDSELVSYCNFYAQSTTAGTCINMTLDVAARAVTASSTTFNVRGGPASSGTCTFNGNGTGSPNHGSLATAFLEVEEIMT